MNQLYVYYNSNPRNRNGVGDCTVRSLTKALGISWEEAYIDLVMQGYLLADMPSSNMVLDTYLKSQGFSKHIIDNENCEDCYTVADFTRDHPYGTYILGTGSHMVTVKDGHFYDSWPSGDEVPLYYYRKEATW